MALSLGAQGIAYLEDQQWDVGLSYRYLHSDRVFSGSHDQPDLRDSSVSDIHSFDLTTTYAFTKRLSATLTLPFLHAQHTSAWEHDGVHFHTMTAAGLGDIRLLGNAWLLDPAQHTEGNIALSAGAKFPTGDDNAQDFFTRLPVRSAFRLPTRSNSVTAAGASCWKCRLIRRSSRISTLT